MSVLYPMEQKCIALNDKNDCNNQSENQCVWTEALNQCAPKCDTLPENRCTAYACNWDTMNQKCTAPKEGDANEVVPCEERTKCQGQDAQGNQCISDPMSNKCVPSFVLTESPELLEQTKPPKDSISPAEYQKRMKAGLITLYVILGIIVVGALFVLFVRMGAAGALAGIIVGGFEKVKSKFTRDTRAVAPGPDSSDVASSLASSLASDVGSLASDDESSPPFDDGSSLSSLGDDNPVGAAAAAAAAPAPLSGGSKRNCVRNFVRDLLSRR